MNPVTKIPVRNGIYTIRRALLYVCKVITKFNPLWVQILTSEQYALIQPIMTACENFIAAVPIPTPGDPIPPS